MYATSREPDYFMGVRFLCDRFHECNHTTCSWRYRLSAYPDKVEINSAAAEQVNSKQEKRAKSIRGMNLPHAIISSTCFLCQHNVEQWLKAEAAAT